ncbi:GntR family transcriptional regulator [Humitalea sp. 24SJ18S-53]|uniref:GntR family transcriptional regulator n=1 Tax=Humitalea sp. 24SJ18S-53 TaxID=3422307 RepID=UPI003D6778BC
MSALLERPSDQSLTEFACERLRADIIRCDLAPGASVTEAGLADRYGLGKAPIRAALSRLSQAGLIRSVNRRGYVVAPIIVKEVVEAFDLRLLLEPHAAFHAAGRMPLAVIQAFDDCFAAYRDGDLVSQDAFLAANRVFHLAIARAAGMDKLAAILGDLLDCTERVIRIGLIEWRGPKVMEPAHRALVAALVGGDAEQAQRLAAEGVELGRRKVMDAILKRQSIANVSLID